MVVTILIMITSTVAIVPVMVLSNKPMVITTTRNINGISVVPSLIEASPKEVFIIIMPDKYTSTSGCSAKNCAFIARTLAATSGVSAIGSTPGSCTVTLTTET